MPQYNNSLKPTFQFTGTNTQQTKSSNLRLNEFNPIWRWSKRYCNQISKQIAFHLNHQFAAKWPDRLLIVSGLSTGSGGIFLSSLSLCPLPSTPLAYPSINISGTWRRRRKTTIKQKERAETLISDNWNSSRSSFLVQLDVTRARLRVVGLVALLGPFSWPHIAFGR